MKEEGSWLGNHITPGFIALTLIISAVLAVLYGWWWFLGGVVLAVVAATFEYVGGKGMIAIQRRVSERYPKT